MEFKKGYIFHIYNQGNNRQQIFFNRENYLFFLQKMRKHLLPYGDILAYCLMPNHFHLMMQVNDLLADYTPISDLNSSDDSKSSDEFKSTSKPKSLNNSIAIMLRSYTRAINNQQECSGSLFRQKTKAECLTLSEGITPTFYNTEFGTEWNNSVPEEEYLQTCFNYIHQNPVKAKLVTKASDWEYSSAKEYEGLRKGTLVNTELAKNLLDTTAYLLIR